MSDLRAVRHAVATKLKPHAKLISSESGVSYAADYGTSYPSSKYLLEHGMVVAKSHIMLLGEGVDVSFVFYIADYSYEHGFGINFNLAMPNVDFGSPDVSRKPSAMMVATMTRLLDGSTTLGPLTGLPDKVYG